MLSDSESELFVTQSSFSGSTSIELSENNFESLFAGANNEKAVDNFNLRTEDLLTDLSTDKEDSGREITAVSGKEIQARNEARIPQNTKNETSWSTRVWDDWARERISLPINDTYQRVSDAQKKIVSDVLQGSATDFSGASVESGEPSTKKIRECAAKENTAQFNFRNCSVVFNIAK